MERRIDQWKSPTKLVEEHFHDRVLSEEMGLQADVRPARFAEQAYFSLHITERQTRTVSVDPVFVGLFSAGRRSQVIYGWIDGDYYDVANFQDGRALQLSENGLDAQLFKVLGDLIPPGGSLMVSYSLFSKESSIHKETRLALDRGYPPVVSPLGFLLFIAGCGLGFKDWYFAEGGREGPEKLQGFKPLDAEAAREQAGTMLQELRRFTTLRLENGLGRACRARAEHALAELERISE